jgi:nucleotide-binding universal stress UspA family protein
MEGGAAVTKVIAALDNSVAAGPVLATATSLAKLFGSTVESVHVPEDGGRIAHGIAAAAGYELRPLRGPTVPALIEAGSAEDVAALVLGARRTPAGARPVGGTAFEVMRALPKPVAIVPPDASAPGRLRRVLVPLEGTVSSSIAPQSVIKLAHAANLEVVILHVLDDESLPAFTDQPQHEDAAWRQEFLARWCPWGIVNLRVESRVGVREEQVLLAADEYDVDILALGWSQRLAAGRAPVVRAALERGRVPILLIPVHLAAPEPTNGKEELWSSSQSSCV